MKFSKFIVIPIMIAVLATIVQLIDQVMQATGGCSHFIGGAGFGWLTFQAWAMYFLAGCNIKGGIQVLIGYIAGIIGSILIIMFAGWLGSVGVPGFWTTPLSLLILVIPVICLERVQVMIPALFIGAGAYFAIMTFQPAGTSFLSASLTEVIYCLVGLIFGWITVTLRVAYENSVKE
ncbi:MAG: DUF1097 domain-containing protein [Rikenellaceae bacterium]